MSHDTQAKLAKAVQSLRGSNRPAWDEFLAVLRQRSAERDTAAIEIVSPDGSLFRQGIAIEARRLIAELEEAPGVAELIYNKERQNGGTSPRRTP